MTAVPEKFGAAFLGKPARLARVIARMNDRVKSCFIIVCGWVYLFDYNLKSVFGINKSITRRIFFLDLKFGG